MQSIIKSTLLAVIAIGFTYASDLQAEATSSSKTHFIGEKFTEHQAKRHRPKAPHTKKHRRPHEGGSP